MIQIYPQLIIRQARILDLGPWKGKRVDHLQKSWSKKQRRTVIGDKIFDKLAADQTSLLATTRQANADSRRLLARPTSLRTRLRLGRPGRTKVTISSRTKK